MDRKTIIRRLKRLHPKPLHLFGKSNTELNRLYQENIDEISISPPLPPTEHHYLMKKSKTELVDLLLQTGYSEFKERLTISSTAP